MLVFMILDGDRTKGSWQDFIWLCFFDYVLFWYWGLLLGEYMMQQQLRNMSRWFPHTSFPVLVSVVDPSHHRSYQFLWQRNYFLILGSQLQVANLSIAQCMGSSGWSGKQDISSLPAVISIVSCAEPFAFGKLPWHLLECVRLYSFMTLSNLHPCLRGCLTFTEVNKLYSKEMYMN